MFQGDNCNRISGQSNEFKQLNIHAWEAFDKGQDIHLQAAPSQAELLYREFKVKKDTLKTQTKQDIMNKYGDAASGDRPPMELLLGQTERQVEYDQAGRIVKGQEKAVPKSKYEEDVFINNHTTVWGSWWKDHQWGYKCCKQSTRNSYCTGQAGIEAAEASAELMRTNIERKEALQEKPAEKVEKNLASWGSEVPDDVMLDKKKLKDALKKVLLNFFLVFVKFVLCVRWLHYDGPLFTVLLLHVLFHD